MSTLPWPPPSRTRGPSALSAVAAGGLGQGFADVHELDGEGAPAGVEVQAETSSHTSAKAGHLLTLLDDSGPVSCQTSFVR
ncbi:hypothetical protein GCM10022248_25910 [Nonomuraea soli]